MSQPHLTISTELPAIYFDGPYESDCETPYNLNSWPDVSNNEEWMFRLECMPGQVFTFYGDELRVPSNSTMEDKVAFALRHVCHFLVNQIDNKGMEEVCRSLAEFYAYYRPTDHVPQLPDLRTKHAVVSSRTMSPEFLIEEE